MQPQVPASGLSQPLDPGVWVDEHGDYLFHYALMRMHDDSLAEDAVQEALLAAWRSRSTYEGKSTERTWLTSILKHKILDHYRKSVRENPIGERETDLSELDGFFTREDEWTDHWNNKLQPHNWRTPETTLQQDEFFVVLQNCLSKLPARVAGVFALHEIDGMESNEICEILSLSASNYWTVMHRARLALRRCIEVKWFMKGTDQYR